MKMVSRLAVIAGACCLALVVMGPSSSAEASESVFGMQSAGAAETTAAPLDLATALRTLVTANQTPVAVHVAIAHAKASRQESLKALGKKAMTAIKGAVAIAPSERMGQSLHQQEASSFARTYRAHTLRVLGGRGFRAAANLIKRARAKSMNSHNTSGSSTH